jgi:hypothetical protein
MVPDLRTKKVLKFWSVKKTRIKYNKKITVSETTGEYILETWNKVMTSFETFL